MHHGFVFPNVNCEDLHPEIANLIASERVPKKEIKTTINIAAKASFGFGDVNACVIFRKK
jgi:3-oxoacyl-(acyl-carrier-protein) synthase